MRFGPGRHRYFVPEGVTHVRVVLKGGDGTLTDGEYVGRSRLSVTPGWHDVEVGYPNGWAEITALEEEGT